MMETTTSTTTEYAQPRGSSFVEHLVFVALLLPTFVVVAAAVVSLAAPDPVVAVQKPMLTAAACEPCPPPGYEGYDGP
jgi:hypothetical protein